MNWYTHKINSIIWMKCIIPALCSFYVSLRDWVDLIWILAVCIGEKTRETSNNMVSYLLLRLVFMARYFLQALLSIGAQNYRHVHHNLDSDSTISLSLDVYICIIYYKMTTKHFLNWWVSFSKARNFVRITESPQRI